MASCATVAACPNLAGVPAFVFGSAGARLDVLAACLFVFGSVGARLDVS
jgi:hypothetical protein